jgi:hypothetical protein
MVEIILFNDERIDSVARYPHPVKLANDAKAVAVCLKNQ